MSRQLLTSVTILGIVLAALMAAFVFWLKSQPAWEITTKNLPRGVLIEFYVEDGAEPVHSAILDGVELPREIVRMTREEIPPEIATVVTYDETLKPGLLCLRIDRFEVAVVKHSLVVDGETVSRRTD